MQRSLGLSVRPLGIPGLLGGSRAPSLGRLGGGLRSGLAAVWHGRRARILLLAVLIALPVLGGGFLALRHSSFVAVQRVRVSGVHGAEAPAIEAALSAAARHMSTLDVSASALSAAVAPFRVVSAIRAVPSFPHGLHIEVAEQLAVAALLVNGARTAVAADGVVLGPALLSSTLPTLGGYSQPPAGQRLHDATLLESLALLGAAPRALARHMARVYSGPQGLTVAMRNGLLVYFGDATLPHAKWLSLARVLADHSSAGASYVDVRVPGRPAAGFPAGSGPSATSGLESSGAEATGGSESTVGALAAGLTKATPTSSASAPAPSTSEPSSQAAAQSAGSSSGEATGSEASTEASSKGSPEAETEASTPSG